MKTKIEREQLQFLSIREWEKERQTRADGYASVLHHLNAALGALPGGDESSIYIARGVVDEITRVRGSLRRVLDETNPFAKTGEKR